LKRIADLETYIKENQPIWEVNRKLPLIIHRMEELEESNKVFLKSIPDIEILKTQVQGLVRDVDTLKIQFHNTNLHYNGLIKEVLEQKKFLAKVQAILDRERDARLVNSPSHKKEIEAMKMDKHVDMMVKKGRPRKP